jgi:SAM-dependent methyltransferase
MTEWFEQWFGEEYHALYPHRDAEDAQRAIALVRHVAPWGAGERVLDLACGAGRHAAELERAGARVVGLDLSPSMLHHARGRTAAPLVRGDMRALPFGPASFGVVVNLFTSFGYFRNDAEHLQALRQVGEVLAPGGRFLLDYFNANRVRRDLRDQTESAGAMGAQVRRRFSEEGRYVVKVIELRDETRSFQERVRLFTPDDLAALLSAAGLEVLRRFGDYDGTALTEDSPRAILLARRP